jgi:hypothetical protein
LSGKLCQGEQFSLRTYPVLYSSASLCVVVRASVPCEQL